MVESDLVSYLESVLELDELGGFESGFEAALEPEFAPPFSSAGGTLKRPLEITVRFADCTTSETGLSSPFDSPFGRFGGTLKPPLSIT